MKVYLEQGAKDGWCLVHCPDLPGLGFKAPSREIALALAPLRVEAELDWVAKSGLPVEEADPAASEVEVVGAVAVEVPVAAGDSEAIFGPEMSALDSDYLSFILKYLKASRHALARMVDRLPDSALNWRPARGKRSLGEVLGHIADGEAFYMVRLETPEEATKELWERYANPKLPPRERLDRTRHLVIERLGGLSEEDMSRISRHEPHSETWTARKVLRRLVWHERYHTRQIEAYLTT